MDLPVVLVVARHPLPPHRQGTPPEVELGDGRRRVVGVVVYFIISLEDERESFLF